jgi:hypothetical protein
VIVKKEERYCLNVKDLKTPKEFDIKYLQYLEATLTQKVQSFLEVHIIISIYQSCHISRYKI